MVYMRSWVQFVNMLFGQISGQHGLRSIEQGMNSHYNSMYHPGIPCGGKPVKRSTLSYANTHRSSNLFKAVFEWLLGEAQKLKSPHGFKFKNPPSMSQDVRLRKIITRDAETGKEITLLTNNLQWLPKTIGAIYKERWQIELFRRCYFSVFRCLNG
jgi:IS4 transposase